MAEIGAVSNELIADPDVVRAVADALAQDDRTAAYVLRIDARHGIVVLRGEVPNEAVRQAALEIAAHTPTVGSVRDQLVVGGDVRPAIALARPAATADQTNPIAASGVQA
jgi:hypothetical protein